MIKYTDESGRNRTGPNGRNQYLNEAVGVFPPAGENWHLADEWSKDLAGKLIAIGWPNADIEEYKREAKSLPNGIKRSDEAKGCLHVYSFFVKLADVAIAAGILRENDSPARWLAWAESKNYEIAHLTRYMGRAMSDDDAAFFAFLDDMLSPHLISPTYGEHTADHVAEPASAVPPVPAASTQKEPQPQAEPASGPVMTAAAPPEQTDDAGLLKRERQIRAIEAAAAAQNYDALSIPKGGKKILMKQCQESNLELFGAGPDPFNDAWKVAITCKPPRLRMTDHNKFARK